MAAISRGITGGQMKELREWMELMVFPLALTLPAQILESTHHFDWWLTVLATMPIVSNCSPLAGR